jgi:hypothetical protein
MIAMPRENAAIPTEFKSVRYRSRTEARWAVFFDSLGLTFRYEPQTIRLSSGEYYLPDFMIDDFEAHFEVKPSNDGIVTEECTKARQLAADRNGQRVWLAMGAPAAETPNILPLEKWPLSTKIEEILGTPENRYYFLEDRRDDRVYWLQANFVSGNFKESYMVGGPGVSTDHERLPLLRPNIVAAYKAAHNAF